MENTKHEEGKGTKMIENQTAKISVLRQYLYVKKNI